MKTLFNILARLVACAVLTALSLVSGLTAKFLADDGSAWYLLAMLICMASFFAALRVMMGSGEDRPTRDFDPRREDPRAAACKEPETPARRIA